MQRERETTSPLDLERGHQYCVGRWVDNYTNQSIDRLINELLTTPVYLAKFFKMMRETTELMLE